MGVVIHDDYWEASQAMPEKQRPAFLYAIIAYRFTGEEPKGKPAWLPTFIAIKKRIEMGDEASKKGRDMALARWGKKQDAGAQPKHDAQAHAQAHAAAYAQASDNQDAEDEVEKEVEVEYPLEVPPFGLLCLKALNEALGTSYATLPSKSALCLSRMEGRYEPDEVRRMVEFKRDEWMGTRFANNLTPNTLFSPDHFEQYMHQSRSHAAEKSEYDIYD